MEEELQKILSNNEMGQEEKTNAINKVIIESMASDTGSEGEIQFENQNEIMAMYSK